MALKESDLYEPVKAFLVARGYEVKGEIGPCDLFAVREDGETIVVELKTRLTLDLVLQGVDRLSVCETVYLAIPTSASAWRRRRRSILGLLRRLGLGLVTVGARGGVTVVLDPGPYRPRGSATRRKRLLREFDARSGDPETGGSAQRVRMTAWRQDNLRLLRALADSETRSVAWLRSTSGVASAARILQRDPLGWFERVRRGHYRRSAAGRAAFEASTEAIEELWPPSDRQEEVSAENATSED